MRSVIRLRIRSFSNERRFGEVSSFPQKIAGACTATGSIRRRHTPSRRIFKSWFYRQRRECIMLSLKIGESGVQVKREFLTNGKGQRCVDCHSFRWRLRLRRGPNDRLLYVVFKGCLLYTSPSPRDKRQSRMPSSA